MVIKIGTLNLCLGIQHKKNIVKQIIIDSELDILCLQETELDVNIDHELLSFQSYNYESEINSIKSRVGVYIKQKMNYVRRRDLEGSDSHLVIIDIKSKHDLRIITIYRPFNPQGGVHPKDFFHYQISLARAAMTNNTVFLGDFNLDWGKKNLLSYQFNSYLEIFDDALGDCGLTQLVEFPTWSRIVNGQERSSILDHVYVTNPSKINDVTGITPYFGDHKLLCFEYLDVKIKPSIIIKRNWTNYKKETLTRCLKEINWGLTSDSVQGCWDEFENKLIRVVDVVAPLVEFVNDSCVKSVSTPAHIKTLLNRRKRLLLKKKKSGSAETNNQIKTLDAKICLFYHSIKWKNVRKCIIPGNTSGLWKAVKTAKDVNTNVLPNTMYEAGDEIDPEKLPERFAKFFDDKIKNVLAQTSLDENVYNGYRKVNSESKFFMTYEMVGECISSLKIKNTEGYDRIPQRVLVDGIDELTRPLSIIFKKIYHEKAIPGQWLIAKTIPIFKNKGEKKNIENYRPIANLCSASKVFEKLILKRLLDIEDENNCDLTGINQHGFKRGRSTSTLSIEIQNLIARALDEDKTVLLASLDLSAAFDIVNISLLLKRLRIMGLPNDIIDLIEVWLRKRMFYVSMDGSNSRIYDLLLGTVQGSILGPVLYAMFIAPVFDIENLYAFADDKFVPTIGDDKAELVRNTETSIENIRKWIKQSGLKINEKKTEICLFYKRDTDPVNVMIGEDLVTTSDTINILGVTFDSKMAWSQQIRNAISKSSRALNALSIIRRYFNTKELLQLVTSNFYSILYYNSEVWNIHTLKQFDKNLLMSASAKALKMATHYKYPMLSYENLHRLTNRSTPEMLSKYKLAIQLHKTYNCFLPEREWITLNFTQTLMSRQVYFHVNRSNMTRVGMNILCNRFFNLNDKIPLNWLNKSVISFKLDCKNCFLKF